MSDARQTPPGWYRSECVPPGTERYWDGNAWTDQSRPVPPPPPAVPRSDPGGTRTAKYRGGKTKAFFSFGVYLLFWHYSLLCNLREDYGAEVPSYGLLFVPFYSCVVWWRTLAAIKRTQQGIGMGATLSVGRAFWLSGLWFASVPYVNRHVNALYTFRSGGQTAVGAARQLGMMRPTI